MKMKFLVSTFLWMLILVPFALFLVLVGMVSLEASFGIAPPVGLTAAAFVLAILFSVFSRIGAGFKSFPSRFKTKPEKRLLRVRFLQQREQA